MINTVNQNLQYLLPLDLELSNEGLKKWLQKRTIHRNRAYVSNFLSRLGLNEKDTKGNIIRQERYSGSCSRSFYVGDSIKKGDIKANYDNGELKIYLPKTTTKEVENHNYIPIE